MRVDVVMDNRRQAIKMTITKLAEAFFIFALGFVVGILSMG